MKVYNATDIERLNWLGLKPLAMQALSWKPINDAAVAMARIVLPDRLRRRMPVIRDHVSFPLHNGARVKLSFPQCCHVAREIYWSDGAMASSADRLVLNVVQRLAPEAPLFLDIGAYTGFFALIAIAVNPQSRAECYEILPENYAILLRNIWLNDAVGRVEAKLLGLGDREDNIRMPLASGAPGLLSSLSLGSHFADGVAIPVSTLDLQLPNFNAHAMIKIDVEGFEAEVLRGGRAFIARVRPDIVCELLPDASGAQEIETMLSALDYRFHQFTDTGLIHRRTIVPSREGRDWLFTTRPESDLSGF